AAILWLVSGPALARWTGADRCLIGSVTGCAAYPCGTGSGNGQGPGSRPGSYCAHRADTRLPGSPGGVEDRASLLVVSAQECRPMVMPCPVASAWRASNA